MSDRKVRYACAINNDNGEVVIQLTPEEIQALGVTREKEIVTYEVKDGSIIIERLSFDEPKSFRFKITKEDVGFSAEGIDLEGCITQGEDIDDLVSNVEDALSLYLNRDAYSPRPATMCEIKGDELIVRVGFLDKLLPSPLAD